VFFQLKFIFHMLEVWGRPASRATTPRWRTMWRASWKADGIRLPTNCARWRTLRRRWPMSRRASVRRCVDRAFYPRAACHCGKATGTRGRCDAGAYRQTQVQIAQSEHLRRKRSWFRIYAGAGGVHQRGASAKVRPDQGGIGASPLRLDTPVRPTAMGGWLRLLTYALMIKYGFQRENRRAGVESDGGVLQ